MNFVLQSIARRIRTCWSGKKGQTLVEYALIMCLISIVLIAVFSLLDARIIVIFSAITNILDTAQGSNT